YFAVAYLSCLRSSRGVHNGFDRRFHKGVVDGDFELQFRQQPHLKLGAAVDLGVAALPAAATDIADGHEIDVALVESGLDGFQLLRADDGHDEFHAGVPAKKLTR